MPERRISDKAARFTESVIREMTRLAAEFNAINLAQGFPNFAAPDFIKDAACRAIRQDINQYAITWGAPNFRQAIAGKYGRIYGLEVHPEKEVTVGCGATECMIASILAVVNPGERVMVFEPFYENYGPDSIIAGAEPVYVSLDPNDGWSFDPAVMERQLEELQPSGGVRALILNSPNNPTGKVFSLEELQAIARLAQRFDFYVITDEIYEHILYEGRRHIPIASLPGMRDRTITVNGLSKTFSVTGWRLGYIVAPADLSNAIRKMHDFLTVGAAAPLQDAAAHALEHGDGYYEHLAELYLSKRDRLLSVLNESGFKTWTPYGAYYIMTDISGLTDMSDVEFVRHMIQEIGVAAVPGSSFYRNPKAGRHMVRFAFCKTPDLLDQVAERFQKLRA